MTLTISTTDTQLDQTSISILISGQLSSNKAVASTSFKVSFISMSVQDFTAYTNPTGNQTVKPLPLLNATITDFDFTQKVTIRFQKPMQVPKNLTTLVVTKSLSFFIRQANSGKQLKLVTGWSVVSYAD